MITVLLLLSLFAADWPQFRGPNASGVSDQTGLPTKLGTSTNVLWKVSLPRGASSPVVVDGRLYLTGAEGRELITYAIDPAGGQVLWRQVVFAEREERLNGRNDPASSTPVSDGSNVYSFFGNFGLVSYDRDGKERWRLPLGPFNNRHGMAASPLFADGKLIMLCDQDTDAFLLAVNPETGQTLWKIDRPHVQQGYSTPVIWNNQIIVPGSHHLAGYSLDTGERIWWLQGLTWQPKSIPVLGGDVLYFNGWAPGGDPGEEADVEPFSDLATRYDRDADGSLTQEELPEELQPQGWDSADLNRDGFMNSQEWGSYRSRYTSRNGLVAVKLGGEGDVTNSHLLWRRTRSLPDVPTPLLYQGVLYLVRNGGIAMSLDPTTGEVLKRARLTGAIDDYYASPVAADNKIYMVSQTGKVTVLKPGAQWEILSQTDLDDEAYATPAIADGKIYLRTRGTLYCFAKPALTP